MNILLFFLCLFLYVNNIICSMQNITVKGTLVCNKKRLPDMEILLKERDTISDDEMGKVISDKEGEFTIFGQQDEFFSIDPYIIIKHNCNVNKAGCYRHTEFEIPKKRIGDIYDMTYITLDIVQYKDKEKC